jgi:flagellar biosynthesis/type III secretory pathway protein FliH
MSSPKEPSAVLRQPLAGSGTRRLSGMQSAGPATTSSVEGEQDKIAVLRNVFHVELEQLRLAAQQEGLAQARQLAAKEHTGALQAAQAEQARKWQQEEERLRKSLQQQHELLAKATAQLNAHHQQLVSSMEPVVGRLTIAVVNRLLGKRSEAHSLIAELAQQAIKEYRLGSPLAIKVAAIDYPAIQSGLEDDALLALFQIDHEAKPGSCLIDYGTGQLDAGVDTQLTAIRKLLQSPDKEVDRVGEV